MRRGFTLIEMLVVIAIITILSAIAFPAFARAKAAAKQSTCLSNLSQIGKGILIYMEDYDDAFPRAVDASDRFATQIWSPMPEWQSLIASLPMMHEVLQPYVRSKELFQCPADTGSAVLDNHFPVVFSSAPSMYRTFGSSYFFRTEIAFREMTGTSFQLPAAINVMFDGAGHWHSSSRRIQLSDAYPEIHQLQKSFRYNTLFGDMHVKSQSYGQLQAAWRTPL